MELFEGMPERVASAFKAYVELDSRRSLKTLAAKQPRGSRAIAMLKRWSVRYNWQARLVAHEREIAAEMGDEFNKAMQRKISSHLEAINAMQERFYERVLIDPNDPSLTAAQRRRALRPTVRDFYNLIKIEKLIMGGNGQSFSRPASHNRKRTSK